MNILFLTSRLPFPPVGGDRLRMCQFLRHLSRRHRVTVASFVESEREAHVAVEYRQLYDRLLPVVLPRSRSYLNCIRGLASTDPLQVRYYSSPRMREVVAEELATRSYDAVFCHLIRMAQYLPDDSRVRKVVDFCDAISLLHDRSMKLRPALGRASLISALEARRVGSYERAAFARTDASIFVSEVDANHFRLAGMTDGITVISQGVDPAQFPFTPDSRDDNRIVFLGNMRTFPNTDAVVYFVKEVFPIIQSERPRAVFYIVGNEPSRRVRALHNGTNVIVTGRVDSVIPYLAGAAVMVAPMRSCAGVQTKILESLAIGTPVVATTMGAEGLDPGIMTVADSPREFADATLELMNNPHLRRERAIAGRAHVDRNCTWENSLERLDSVLAGASATREPTTLQSNPA